MNDINKRREFLKNTGKVAGFGLFAGAFGSMITSCEQDELPPKPISGERVDFDTNLHPQLSSPGSHKIVKIDKVNGDDPVIVKHNPDSTWLVMDAICRHQACNVELPNSSDGVMTCICHQATFSFTDGKVIDNKGFNVPDMQVFETEYNSGNKILTIILA
ncbi:MAG: Rieske 2Fe-2S domain-containing protein [Candidatus Kapabacteria bacterium]|nr:Rieske 2Fe-2S domain-containing protein [Ignavibacteriota bacterium]MCW5885769.1 Rieske 2Fe-2S domain-containing protein [Candidatus Kapabacteria bacterium]